MTFEQTEHEIHRILPSARRNSTRMQVMREADFAWVLKAAWMAGRNAGMKEALLGVSSEEIKVRVAE